MHFSILIMCVCVLKGWAVGGDWREDGDAAGASGGWQREPVPGGGEPGRVLLSPQRVMGLLWRVRYSQSVKNCNIKIVRIYCVKSKLNMGCIVRRL